MSNELLWSTDGHVGYITINRPTRGNSFTLRMIREWSNLLDEAAHADDVRVVVLQSTGKKIFCSGIDLSEMSQSDATLTPLQRKSDLHDCIHDVARAIDRLDKPVVASINGAAVGAGLDMALMCDLRIAARSARFAESYVRFGLVPGGGAAYYLPRLVGPSFALEMLLTGDFIDSQRALNVGLVNKIVSDERLADETAALAQRLASAPPVASRLIKRLVYQSMQSDLRTSLDLASSHFAIAAATEDASEALLAHGTGRTPMFTGR